MVAARRLCVETRDEKPATMRLVEGMTRAVASRAVSASVLAGCCRQAMGPLARERGKVLVTAWKRDPAGSAWAEPRVRGRFSPPALAGRIGVARGTRWAAFTAHKSLIRLKKAVDSGSVCCVDIVRCVDGVRPSAKLSNRRAF
jgi:hypothetical protein